MRENIFKLTDEERMIVETALDMVYCIFKNIKHY